MHTLIRAVAFLVLAMALPCTGTAQPVTLVSTEYPPYFAKTLPEGGTLVALARAALSASGRELTVVYRPWARLLKELEHGSHDGVVAVWFKEERTSYLIYTDPVVDTSIGFYARKGTENNAADLLALRGKTIGTVRGYANPPRFEAAKLRTEEANDDLGNLRKLEAGRLDLVLIDRALAQWLIRKEIPQAIDTLVWLNPALETMPLYIGISRNKPGAQALAKDFNRGLAEIRRNGEYARILKRLPLTQD
jgi:polar amino acid transport system substrate-binding protein